MQIDETEFFVWPITPLFKALHDGFHVICQCLLICLPQLCRANLAPFNAVGGLIKDGGTLGAGLISDLGEARELLITNS